MNTPADIPDVEEIARFLRRFSAMMSTGQNADHLLRAATLLEYLAGRAMEAEQLLQQEIVKSEANSNLYELVTLRSADLEAEIAEMRRDIGHQQGKLSEALATAAADERQLRGQAEQAELKSAAIETELLETRSRLASLGDTHVLVPTSSLRQAQAQFEALAGQVNDIVSEVMCAVGVATLDRAISESAVQPPVPPSAVPIL